MKHILFSLLVLVMISAIPNICLAQSDTANAIKPTANVNTDSAMAKTETPVDTVAIKKVDSSSVVATPTNCYKQWMDAFAERKAKPVTDGTHEVVIAFKSKESCRCFLGKVEIAEGKIKAPLYVQTEGGDYKTFVAMGKKLDLDFVSVQGEALWQVTNGMSVLFQTVEQEYGRVFFYKSLNKNKDANKDAPSPADLLK
jgi:hypothetical protein